MTPQNQKEFRSPATAGGGFRLAGFPKEFERNFWDYLDKRFYLILLITWVVSYIFVFYMSSLNWELGAEEMEKLKRTAIQQAYGAEILAETTPLKEEEEMLSTEVEAAAAETEKISEEGKKIVEESATERVQRRVAARASIEENVRKMEQEVAGAGILAIATAAGGAGTGETGFADVLRDIAGGAGGVQDVGKIVSGTVGIGVAETGAERTRLAKGGGYGEGGEGVGIDELIKGQGPSRTADFRRRGEIQLSGNLEITGSAAGSAARDQNGLLRVINRNKGTVEYCYQKRLKVNPNLRGEIYIEIEISPAGKINYVKILNSTLRDKELEDCIVKNIRRWRGFGKIDPALGNVRTRFKYIF